MSPIIVIERGGWWSSFLIHLSCLGDDVFIFRSSASSTSENTTQSMFYPFIKNRTTRLCNNYERIPSKKINGTNTNRTRNTKGNITIPNHIYYWYSQHASRY